VQILPPPEGAPLTNEGADNPFVLEFPIQDAGVWPSTNYSITNQRRSREHRKLTLLLNLLLVGTTKFLPDRRRSFWANVHSGGESKFEWVQEWYFADFGQIVVQELSAPVGKELEVLTSDNYYKGSSALMGAACAFQMTSTSRFADISLSRQRYRPNSIVRPIG
jgi:hypothetical protein